jgi:predicted transposase YbfD/YdcC
MIGSLAGGVAMDKQASRDLLRYLEEIPDPRAANVSFALSSLLAMAVLGVLCRCDDFDEIAFWAEQRADWLAEFLPLPRDERGVRTPHAATLERVFRRIRPAALERTLIAFTAGMAESVAGRQVVFDGKTLRGSIDQGGRKAGLHLIHAWDQHHQLVLGQLACADKSNEITAVPKLLELLDVSGAVVSMDAMHCQKDTAKAIRKAGADYLLAIKDNQKTLHEDVKLFFDDAIQQADEQLLICTMTPDNSHGRLDERTVWASGGGDVAWLRRRHPDWPDLRGIVCVESRRWDFKTSQQAVTRRYYLTSLRPVAHHAGQAHQATAMRLAELVRGHWGVENQLHWCLDVALGDDASRVRKDHGPRNLAAIRRHVLNLLRANPPQRGKYGSPSDRISLKRRRFACLLDEQYLLQTFFKT